MYKIEVPVPFDGPSEVRRANYDSHRWTAYDELVECQRCASASWSWDAYWPCGAEVPRMTIETEA
jgi:hypothetical protein